MCLLRDEEFSKRVYVSIEIPTGAWIPAMPTDIPDCPSLSTTVSLDDGTVLLVGNQVAPKFDNPDEKKRYTRDPLTVSVSSDGYVFERAYALRTGVPEVRVPGVEGRGSGGGQYPSAIIHNGTLYVQYSMRKEDIWISVVPLSDLGVFKYARDKHGKRPESVIAINNVCAWPNLTVLKDGTIAAIIHNEASHLRNPSDLECWASQDDGRTWEKRGKPGPRDNDKAMRGNVAAGLAANGDLVVICSGWSGSDNGGRGTLLPLLVSRSSDGGYTWDIDRNAFPEPWSEHLSTESSPEGYPVPFGDIIQGNDGTLRVGMYRGLPGKSFVYRSRDDGHTWVEPVVIHPNAVVLEPALYHLGEGRWLCASRNPGDKPAGMDLYTSDDDANTWTFQKGLTPSSRLPGHFLQLQDGRIVLTYGNRYEGSRTKVPRGIEMLVSEDDGKTWSGPVRLADFFRDGGYPSSVQLRHGQVLTAYYARKVLGHEYYHMGTVIWDPVKSIDR
ncbi:hypothetical protein BVY01_04345 [bacterium I07]|nr:hypothetical protein BVY01_04345 [bacterium I07]